MTKKKVTINIIDENIAHAGSYAEANLRCGGGLPRYPQKVEYIWNRQYWDGISVFTDKCLFLVPDVQSPVKVAWLMEPKAYDPRAYNLVQELEEHFNLILTHDIDLLKRDSTKYVYLPADTNIIEDASIAVHPKSKLTSFIYSEKQFLEGHKMRHEIAKLLAGKNYDIDSYGHGCKSIERKAEALSDYYFSIAVENSSADNYFTDKILDCFVTGTIPIYWGCPNVGNYFNMDGVFHFSTLKELSNILDIISPAKYEEMLGAVNENFHKALYYMRLDDIMVDTILSSLNLVFPEE